MRILLTIPHYAGAGVGGESRPHGSTKGVPRPRIAALTAALAALHQNFGPVQCSIDHVKCIAHPIPHSNRTAIDIVICTTGDYHFLADLEVDRSQYRHCATKAEPLLLGFECHRVLSDLRGKYDYYCYLEDDLVIEDPWFFTKLAWFSGHVGNDKLIQPNRFESGPHGFLQKAYIDGDLAESATARFQNVRENPVLESQVLGRKVSFRRPFNPHAGCFFLNADQMQLWSQQPHFLARDCSFMGPLESAATLGVMRTFKIYKPASDSADFLEVRHYGHEYLKMITRPPQR